MVGKGGTIVDSKPIGSRYLTIIERTGSPSTSWDIVMGYELATPGGFKGDETFLSEKLGIVGLPEDTARSIYEAIQSPKDFDAQLKEYKPG